jgi:hypothetical protein
VVKRRVDKINTTRSGNDTPRPARSGNDRKRKAGEIPAEDSEDEGGARGEKTSIRGGNGQGRGGKRQTGVRPGRGDKRDRGSKNGDSKPSRDAEKPSVDAPSEKKGLEKLGNHLGSLIGRKRKARKGN